MLAQFKSSINIAARITLIKIKNITIPKILPIFKYFIQSWFMLSTPNSVRKETGRNRMNDTTVAKFMQDNDLKWRFNPFFN